MTMSVNDRPLLSALIEPAAAAVAAAVAAAATIEGVLLVREYRRRLSALFRLLPPPPPSFPPLFSLSTHPCVEVVPKEIVREKGNVRPLYIRVRVMRAQLKTADRRESTLVQRQKVWASQLQIRGSSDTKIDINSFYLNIVIWFLVNIYRP